MTIPTQESQIPVTDKELNFRKLESKYQQEVAFERSKREEAERKVNELSQRQVSSQEEEEDIDVYIDHKNLEKKLAKHGQQVRNETQTEINKAVSHAIREEKKQNWIKQNPDFYDVLQHAEELATKVPELAESILEMPESFERQKLVYKSIKALGLNKPLEKEPSIQQKIDANRRSPFYQPSGIGSSPYQSQGDFSPSGQKQAYDKMKELQARLRL